MCGRDLTKQPKADTMRRISWGDYRGGYIGKHTQSCLHDDGVEPCFLLFPGWKLYQEPDRDPAPRVEAWMDRPRNARTIRMKNGPGRDADSHPRHAYDLWPESSRIRWSAPHGPAEGSSQGASSATGSRCFTSALAARAAVGPGPVGRGAGGVIVPPRSGRPGRSGPSSRAGTGDRTGGCRGSGRGGPRRGY